MRLLLATFLVLLAPAYLAARAPDLAEYEGQYEYRDGLSLYVIKSGDQLVAVIDQSKYLLRLAGPDTFLNPPGDSIPFVRDSEGRVAALKEYGQSFARISPEVPTLVRRLLEPRPKGPRGKTVAYRYQPPPQLSDGIPAGSASPQSLSSAVAERLVNGVIDETFPDVRSILVFHRGELRLEEYFYGFDRDRPHGMRSFSKSVISLLAGAASDRGLLRADEPAVQRLGLVALANADPRKAKITLAQMLSNRSGLACNEHDRTSPGSEVRLFETDDWVKTFFDLPMLDDPGSVARYCSGGFFATGRMIEIASARSLPEFADGVLFGPLGISRDQWKWNFTLDRTQRNEFGQVYLRPRDMLKLGILIRDRGLWKGRRVISASWIDAMVARQSQVEDSGYGLGIWHRFYNVQTPAGAQRVDTIMLSGNGGQKVFLVPSLDLIVVSTGNAFFVESPVNTMLTRILLPALMKAPVAAN